MRDAFVRTLLEEARNNEHIELITGDLGFGVLRPFIDALPQRITNAGIAEQNMISVAAGMAKEGKNVFVYSIGNFPTLRCLEQIRNDCAYHELDVKIVCVGGGFVYGALGMSHHATEDVAVLRALPKMTVFAPGDAVEAECATRALSALKGAGYLRLSRGGEETVHDKIENFTVGKAVRLMDGDRVAIFSSGGILQEAFDAARALNARGIKTALYSFPTVKPIDEETVAGCARKNALIITVEEHNIVGGFGSAVAEAAAGLKGRCARVVRVGVKDEYFSIAGSQAYLRELCGLSARKIVERTLAELEEGGIL